MPTISGRILVVDDDDLVRQLLMESLGRRKGLQLDEASSKATALDMVARSRYDLVLTDIRMEEQQTGIDLLRAVKERSPSTAVILITGYGALGTAIDAIREGADDYLLKPLSLAELDTSVELALERRALAQGQRNALEQAVAMLQTLATDPDRPADAPGGDGTALASSGVLKAGNIVVDADRHQAMVDGVDIELTPTELMILKTLLAAHGRLVTFESLVAASHQLEARRDDARDLLASHIRNLRRKLGNSASQLINVRGIGYYIEREST